MGPWVVVERFTNGKTYWVRDLATEQERQVTRDQIKVLDVPSAWEGRGNEVGRTLPRVSRVELGEGVIAHQPVRAGEASKEVIELPSEPSIILEDSDKGKKRSGEVQQATNEDVHATESPMPQDFTSRYSLRQVPERLALQAEKRRRLGNAK